MLSSPNPPLFMLFFLAPFYYSNMLWFKVVKGLAAPDKADLDN
jgi:hypothetical protein